MGWKSQEPPLNLIQILPSERKASKVQLSHEHPQNLRIQVGDESPSTGMGFLGQFILMFRKIFNMARIGMRTIGAWCRTVWRALFGGIVTFGVAVWTFGKNIFYGAGQMLFRSAQRVQVASGKFEEMLARRRVKSNRRRPVSASPTEEPVIDLPRKLEHDEILLEVHTLQDQLTAQRNELTRVNTQMSELKALALSQQQVLLHLGKELESLESKAIRPEKTVSKKSKSRSVKASKPKSLPASVKPSLHSSFHLESPQ